MTSRRAFLTGLGSIICAPAIVRASSLMPVKAYSFTTVYEDFGRITSVTMVNGGAGYVAGDFFTITRKAFVPHLYQQIYDSEPLLDMMGAR